MVNQLFLSWISFTAREITREEATVLVVMKMLHVGMVKVLVYTIEKIVSLIAVIFDICYYIERGVTDALKKLDCENDKIF